MADNTNKSVRFKIIFRSLQYRNYRLFFSGQSISLIGTWIQRIAMPWLVYHMTGSTLLLGVVSFAGQIPTFLLSPVAGVLTDRWSRYRVLLITQIILLKLGRIIPAAAILFGAGLIILSLSRNFPLSLALMVFIGLGMMMQTAASNTVLQTITDDDKRGRVMSFYTMAIMGTAPFGSLMAGGLAKVIGTPGTILAGGIATIIGALFFLRKLPELETIVRPIYVKMGIIPEVAAGIQTASESTAESG